MKIGKEAIVGLLVALEQYASRDDAAGRAEYARQLALVESMARDLSGLPSIRVETIHDEAGRAIVRAAVHVDSASGRSAADLARALADGGVYLRSHHAPEGFVAIDPRPIGERDARLIVDRIREWANTAP
jgi:seryl-tRNA(Sec) selenium transferase